MRLAAIGLVCLAFLCPFGLHGDDINYVRSNTNVKSVSALDVFPLDAPREYTFGSFIEGGEYISLGGYGEELNPYFNLKNYIVINRKGDIVRKLERVLLWNKYGVILKMNEVNVLLYINALTDEQKIVDMDTRHLKLICFNPSTNKMIYKLYSQCVIHEYDFVKGRHRPLARIDRDNFFSMYQLTDNVIMYIRPQLDMRIKGTYFLTLKYSFKLPLYITSLKTFEESEVALISGNGVLVHFIRETGEVVFVVEEKGHFKLISNLAPNRPRKIPLSSLNQYGSKYFHGLVLNYSCMHPDGNIIAISRLKLRRAKKFKPGSFEFLAVDSENFTVEESEIYLLDIKGNYKQLTDTPDKIELVCDWSPRGNKLLYYDHKSKKFNVLELGTTL